MYVLSKGDLQRVSGGGLAQDVQVCVELSVDAYKFLKGVAKGIKEGWDAEGTEKKG